MNDVENRYQQLKTLLNNIGVSKTKRIQVKIGDKIRHININEIYFLKAEDKYIDLHTYDKHYLLNTSLNTLEASLSDDFVRIHRSAIINLEFMDEIVKMSNNLYQVKMKDKSLTRISVSRKYKSNLSL